MLQSLYLSLPSADARKFVVAVRDARKARDERIEAAIARTESFGAGIRPKALHADWP